MKILILIFLMVCLFVFVQRQKKFNERSVRSRACSQHIFHKIYDVKEKELVRLSSTHEVRQMSQIKWF
jgi:hypothetical protein